MISWKDINVLVFVLSIISIVLMLFNCDINYEIIGIERKSLGNKGALSNSNNKDTFNVKDLLYYINIYSKYVTIRLKDKYKIHYSEQHNMFISSWRTLSIRVTPKWLMSANDRCLVINPINVIDIVGDSMIILKTFSHDELLSTARVSTVLCLDATDTLIVEYSYEEDLHSPIFLRKNVIVLGFNIAFVSRTPVVYNKLLKIAQKVADDSCYWFDTKMEFNYIIKKYEQQPNVFNQTVYTHFEMQDQIVRIKDSVNLSVCLKVITK